MILAIWLVFACTPQAGRQGNNLTGKAKGKTKNVTEGIPFFCVSKRRCGVIIPFPRARQITKERTMKEPQASLIV